jgi:hypothetical protein
MKLRLVVAAVAALIVAPAALAGYPSSMASTGDSITRAFNTGWLPLVDWPSNSLSTGSSTTEQPLPAHPRGESGHLAPELQQRRNGRRHG